MNHTEFESLIRNGARGHFVGIGGVSMSALAEVLLEKGITVTGSDVNESDAVKHLRQIGIAVAIGHDAKNVEGADFLVRTAAARDDNPEVMAAREKGIPVFERAEAWGSIMRHYENAICVSGTHGKTTTTSMLTHVFMQAQADPTVMIGGTLPLIRSGHRVGKGQTIIAESCEYYNSFHSFFPTIAIVLNIDADHLDFFKNLDAIKASFRHFAELVPERGWVIYNADDANTVEAMAGLDRRVMTFGVGENAQVRAVNVTEKNGRCAFDVLHQGAPYAHVELSVIGAHNVKNALATCCAAIALGIDGGAVAKGLATFRGAGRRFEYKGTVNGADVYDDYAHHPSELRATLGAARSIGYDRVIVAFQPHTYSRTKALFDEFRQELAAADRVLLAPIYAAREKNTIGISSGDLAGAMENAEYYEDFDQIVSQLRQMARPGDIILTIGAGDIYKVGDELVK
ncbi:MAG: UDP-N-acetylmuramate--L-alanine ligase [Oscillospiraceae bacterium]|nr:UDP-N-acetylmuramate--L-alanine ligase [Oscillospiraceae bacterium]